MIALDSVSMQLGDFALEGISLLVERGGYAVLMGRTGSGKTSLLEAICGLRRCTAGRIRLDGEDVTDRRPGERGIGYLPQDGALFPTMPVGEQLAFAPRLFRWRAAAIAARVGELAELLELGHLLDRKPPGLSGGEIRRVALGRALAARPRILCLDEPLVGLDDETRRKVTEVLRGVHEAGGCTVLHVTHHLGEAQELADELFHLERGEIRRSLPAPRED
jgi:molybdate/tungstate transport system ATP-binding protein